MKTAILTIALALASALSALAQTVMRENSTVYFQTNVFLHDDPTNPLHQRLSFEGQEPLWVAASNQVVYYQSSEMTNAWLHARYLHATNAILPGYLPLAGGAMTGPLNMGGQDITNCKIFMSNIQAPYIASSPGNKSFALWSSDGVSRLSLTNSGSTSLAFELLNISSTAGYDAYLAGRAGSPVWANIPWSKIDGTNVWQGRVNDTEASRIAALPVSPMTFNSTSWLQSDGTNLFFVSTVPPGFTNALTTNTP